MLPPETLIWQHMPDIFNSSQTLLWRFSKFWRKSQNKTNNCKCFTHFQSFALRWESRITNISHTHHTGIHCFGACLTNLSPPDFSEADLAVLSCKPGRGAHLWIAYISVKRLTSHQMGTLWQVHGKMSKAITNNFLDKDIAHSLLEICVYYCLQTVGSRKKQNWDMILRITSFLECYILQSSLHHASEMDSFAKKGITWWCEVSQCNKSFSGRNLTNTATSALAF